MTLAARASVYHIAGNCDGRLMVGVPQAAGPSLAEEREPSGLDSRNLRTTSRAASGIACTAVSGKAKKCCHTPFISAAHRAESVTSAPTSSSGLARMARSGPSAMRLASSFSFCVRTPGLDPSRCATASKSAASRCHGVSDLSYDSPV